MSLAGTRVFPSNPAAEQTRYSLHLLSRPRIGFDATSEKRQNYKMSGYHSVLVDESVSQPRLNNGKM